MVLSTSEGRNGAVHKLRHAKGGGGGGGLNNCDGGGEGGFRLA